MSAALALPVLDPAEAYLRQVVPAALTGRRVDGAPIRADAPRVRPERLGWFRCAKGWAFAPERLGGEAVAIFPEDGPAAAAMLDRLEPLLRQVELALGVTLEPDAVDDAQPDAATVFRVEREGGDRLWLAVPPGAELLPAAPEFAPELLRGVAVALTLALEGPRVPPHDAATLAPGDLVLLGPGPLAATLTVGDAAPRIGRFDPATGGFHLS